MSEQPPSSTSNPFQYPPEDPVVAERREDIQVASDPKTPKEKLHVLCNRAEVEMKIFEVSNPLRYQLAHDCAEAVGRNPNATIEDFVGVLKLGIDVTGNPALPLYLLEDPSPSSWRERFELENSLFGEVIASSRFFPENFALKYFEESATQGDWETVRYFVSGDRFSRVELFRQFPWLQMAVESGIAVEVNMENGFYEIPIIRGFLQRADTSPEDVLAILRTCPSREYEDVVPDILRYAKGEAMTPEVFEYVAGSLLPNPSSDVFRQAGQILQRRVLRNEGWNERYPQLPHILWVQMRDRYMEAFDTWFRELKSDIDALLKNNPYIQRSQWKLENSLEPELILERRDPPMKLRYTIENLGDLNVALREYQESGEWEKLQDIFDIGELLP